MKIHETNLERLQKELEEIDRYNETPGVGTTRPVYSEQDMAARRYVMQEMIDAGLKVREDELGNLYGVLEGVDPYAAPVWTGSHIDTVPNGGKYDGLIGVFGGLEAVRLIKESGIQPKRSISVNVYSGEEMSRFGMCCIGSRAIAGRTSADDLAAYVAPDGQCLRDALKQCGYDPDRFDEEFPRKEPIHASVELHIEQNSILEKAGVPVGIVEGICAPTNLTAKVRGVQSHAGGTSMIDRRDAYMAAAEISLLLEKLAKESDSRYITGTVGEMTLVPNAANVIPGEAIFSIDIRSISGEDKNDLVAKLREGAEEIAARRNVELELSLQNNDRPVVCDEGIKALLREEADNLGIAHMDLISGAYHDSLILGDLTKVAMIFVPSKDGISHDKAEYTAMEDIARGTDVLAAALLRLANE